MKDSIKALLPGLVTAGILALLSNFLAAFSSYFGAATIALLLGLLLGNSGFSQHRLERGLQLTEKKILEAAIVLLAFGMNAGVFSSLGLTSWLFVISSTIMVILVSLLLSRYFGLSRRLGTLLGAGSAICGSAAIGALSPLLHSREEETGLSIAVINLLSSLGLVLLPLLTGVLALSTEHSGLMIGGVLQSMGHVVGAGFSLGEETGAAATVVKMGRILLIIPLMLILVFMKRGVGTAKKKLSLPLFIPFFIMALSLAQLPFFPRSWSVALTHTGDFLLVAAMVAIGFKIRIRSLFKLAGPALTVGLLTFVFQVLLYLIFLYS